MEKIRDDPEQNHLQTLFHAYQYLVARAEWRPAEIIQKAMQQVGLEILAGMTKRIGKERVH